MTAHPEDPMVTAAIEAGMENLPPASTDMGVPGHTSLTSAARRSRAVTLRLMGFSYDEVAQQCGYTDRSTARKTVMRALDKYEAARVGEMRIEENARLDRAQAAIWPAVMKGDTKAVDTYLRLSARRARMNGLDAPQQVAVTTGAQAALQDALADLRTVVLGEVLESVEVPDDDEPDQ